MAVGYERFNCISIFGKVWALGYSSNQIITVTLLSYAHTSAARGFQKFNGAPMVEFFISLNFAEPTIHVIQAHFYIR